MPRLKSAITLAIIRTIGSGPFWFARSLGSTLGRFLWLLKDRGSRISLENIQLCFPQKTKQEQRALAKKSMLETGKLAGEICFVWYQPISTLKTKIAKIHGEELVLNAKNAGKGVICIAPHLGNWELLGISLACSYGDFMCLYQPPKQAYLEQISLESRQREGSIAVPTNHRGVAALLKHLKNGGITGILPDQCPEQGAGVYSPFFGHMAYTMTLIHKLIQRTNCRAVLGFAQRKGAHFEIFFIEPSTDIYSEDQARSLAAMNQDIEKCIAYCPEQYQWEYKRFKHSPTDEVQRYQWK